MSMRPHSHKGFTWHTVDYFDPGPDVATMTLADGSEVTLKAYPAEGEDLHLMIDAWHEEQVQLRAEPMRLAAEATRETVARHVAKLNAPIEELT